MISAWWLLLIVPTSLLCGFSIGLEITYEYYREYRRR